VTFETKYTDSDFITAIDDGYKTTGYVTRKVGCARKTAETYLNNLYKAGKIEKIVIDNGLSHVWKIAGDN
jgi:hypothetical protein